ncbi:MAG: hypothetical protein AVDCRST_MAG10-1908, partial [uncultured Acidimicrobiales bacterium]
ERQPHPARAAEAAVVARLRTAVGAGRRRRRRPAGPAVVPARRCAGRVAGGLLRGPGPGRRGLADVPEPRARPGRDVGVNGGPRPRSSGVRPGPGSGRRSCEPECARHGHRPERPRRGGRGGVLPPLPVRAPDVEMGDRSRSGGHRRAVRPRPRDGVGLVGPAPRPGRRPPALVAASGHRPVVGAGGHPCPGQHPGAPV